MKLNELPDRATIVAMRGRVDFYYWNGIPVGRAWPKKSTQPRQPGEISSSNTFRIATKMTGAMDPQYTNLLRSQMSPGVGVTWVDMFRAMAMGKPWVRISGS